MSKINTNTYLKITINDAIYDIDSLDSFNNIKKNIFENISKGKHLNDNLTTKYIVTFYMNNLKDMEFYIYNREYIVDLIEDININNINLSLKKIKFI
jgi:hypothetical protein